MTSRVGAIGTKSDSLTLSRLLSGLTPQRRGWTHYEAETQGPPRLRRTKLKAQSTDLAKAFRYAFIPLNNIVMRKFAFPFSKVRNREMRPRGMSNSRLSLNATGRVALANRREGTLFSLIRCRAQFKLLLQLLLISPAQVHSRIVFEDCLIFAIAIEFQPANSAQPHDCGAMRPAEDCRVKLLLQFIQAAA